jgi:hypothetical protein
MFEKCFFMKRARLSPEEMKKGMEPWLAWFNKIGGALVEGGAPLGNGMNFTAKASSKSKSQVTGYSIVQADDMDAVKALVKDHPHFMLPNSSIEVFEIMPIIM